MSTHLPTFLEPDLISELASLDESGLDEVQFGVIGFDAETIVRRYNAFESRLAGLTSARVIGSPLFVSVAPCMNNFLVAQRFEDAASGGTPLDALIQYVFTLKMKPEKVQLRLLSSPGLTLRYVVVNRRLE